ncbi:MAG: hypothetical protein ACK5M4_15985 [Pseudorhodobacter sp.]
MKIWAGIAGLMLLGGCVTTQSGADGSVVDLPENVIQIAAPNQNLVSARLAGDGCYWYRHVGPVETVMLPLRTREGRPICTQPRS